MKRHTHDLPGLYLIERSCPRSKNPALAHILILPELADDQKRVNSVSDSTTIGQAYS